MRHLSLAAGLVLALALTLPGCKSEDAPAPKKAAAAPAPAPEAKATGEEPKKAEAAEEQPLEKATVVLWHAYRAEEQKALEQLIGAYNAKGGPVTIDAIPVPYDAFVDKIGITVPRGNGPDLFIFAHNMIGDWSAAGLLEPVSQWASPELLEQFIPDTVKALVYNKSLYGLPLAFKSLVLYYNKAMVKEAPKTMSELIAAAKANTSGDVVGLAYESSKLYFHAPWLHAFGGAVFDAAGKPAIDSEAAVKATELARALVKEHKVVPSGMTTFMVGSLFNEGKAAMAMSGPWFRGDIAPGIDYGVAVLPTIEGAGPARPFLGSEAIFVSAKSAHKREAFDVAKFLTSNESARVRATVGKQPVANAAVYEDPEVKKDTAMAVFLEQTKSAVIMPASPEMQVVWSTYDAALNRVLFGEAEAKASLTEAQQKAESDISKIAK